MERTEKRCKMTMESKRAVIYARYSSNDYAVAHNMLVIGSYVDRKKTGKTDTRPDFQRMIYESSKHLFDVVLVWRYDRFARNLDDHGAYERLLHKNSVDLISATEEIPEGSHSAIIKAVILLCRTGSKSIRRNAPRSYAGADFRRAACFRLSRCR